MLIKTALVTALLLASPANANFFTYSEWANLDANLGALYMAGAIDTLTSSAPNESGIAMMKHYNDCLSRAKMTDGQLAENVKAFAATRPNLQRSTCQLLRGTLRRATHDQIAAIVAWASAGGDQRL
jgi:hypothetical protein